MAMNRSSMKKEMQGGMKKVVEGSKTEKSMDKKMKTKEGSAAEEAMDRQMGVMPESTASNGGRKAVIAKSMSKMRGR